MPKVALIHLSTALMNDDLFLFLKKIVSIHHKKEAWAFGRILLTLSALFAKPYSLGFVGLPIQHCQTILTNRTL